MIDGSEEKLDKLMIITLATENDAEMWRTYPELRGEIHRRVSSGHLFRLVLVIY